MKRIASIFLIFIFNFKGVAQNPIQDTAYSFFKNTCTYHTDPAGKTKGLKIYYDVPCSWKFTGKNLQKFPQAVCEYDIAINDSMTVSFNMTITQMDISITPQMANQILTPKFMRSLVDSGAVILKTTKTTISDLPCAELISRLHQNLAGTDVFQYLIQYEIFYKNKALTLTYSLGSVFVDKLKDYEYWYTFLFKGLAAHTVISNNFN
jgi:hypothetical protein